MISGSWMDHLFRHSGNLATGKTELVPGQVIKGKVMQLLPERQALLQIGGMKVLAQLESPIEPGERMWFQVQASGQPVQLKAISRLEKETRRNISIEGDIADLAKSLGFEDSPKHKELLLRLMDAKLPITKNTIPAYKAALAETGGDGQSMEMILLAARRGLPLSKEVLQGLKTFFYGTGFTERVDQLKQDLAATVTHVRLSNPDMSKQLELNLQQLSVFQTKEPVSADTIHENLKEIFKGMGLEDSKFEGGDSKRFTHILQELKHILSQEPQLERLVEKTERILQFVHGQQLMASSSEHWLQQLVLHIPLKAFHNHSFLQIEAKKRENGEIDSEHCRLLFCLEMASLGDVMLDVRIMNRIVSIDIVGQQQDKLQLFADFKEELLNGLKNLGYQLSSMKVSEDPHAERQDPLQMGMTLPYRGVDLRI